MRWFSEVRALARIRRVLDQTPTFEVKKARDHSSLGLHWISIAHGHPDRGRVVGSGSDFVEARALLRAWGEFVERWSLRSPLRDDEIRPRFTSNGFAAQLDPDAADRAACLELIERDTVLSAWLLHSGPRAFPDAQIPNASKRRLARLRQSSETVIRLGFFEASAPVGLVGVRVGRRSMVASAAAPTMQLLANQLVRRAAIAVSDFRSAEAPEPLAALPLQASPTEHLRYHLGRQPLAWFDWPEKIGRFEQPRMETIDLTEGNPWAEKTGFHVSRAMSAEAQDLWFGTTRPEILNPSRMKKLGAKDKSLEILNLEPHPFS